MSNDVRRHVSARETTLVLVGVWLRESGKGTETPASHDRPGWIETIAMISIPIGVAVAPLSSPFDSGGACNVEQK